LFQRIFYDILIATPASTCSGVGYYDMIIFLYLVKKQDKEKKKKISTAAYNGSS
jgi:hypothetical protein